MHRIASKKVQIYVLKNGSIQLNAKREAWEDECGQTPQDINYNWPFLFTW